MTDRRLAYLAWLAVCLIWGTTYLGIRISLETMPPALMGAFRWIIAGTLLAVYVAWRGGPLPSRARWPGILLLGFLLLGLGNGGVVVAEQWVSSGLTAVLVATSPFWMAGVEAALPDGDRLRWPVALGLAAGFAGIVVLVWPSLGFGGLRDPYVIGGVIATQIASLGWSLGSAYSRRQPADESVLGTTAYQMLAGGAMMLVAGTIRGEWAELSFTARTAGALAYLSTIGAIGGFVAYTYALRQLPVAFVSLYAYINPVIAVALGVALLGERFDARMALAAVLVLAGVGVVRLAAGGSAPTSREPCEASRVIRPARDLTSRAS